MSKDEKGYNGWTNFETWVTKLWMDNDEGNYSHMKELTEEVRKEAPTCSQVKERIWTVKEAEKYLLADRMQDEVCEIQEQKLFDVGLMTDLLNSAIEKIDFDEIAENLLED